MRAPVVLPVVCMACGWIGGTPAPPRTTWTHLSSTRGELPPPGPSTQQTGAIEPAFLTVEAGGAAHDIDRDGDLDLVFGGDWQSADLFLARIPSDRRAASSCPAIEVYKGRAGEGSAAYAEGIAAADIDGDGTGHFTLEVFARSVGFHEGRLADLNGDGRLDILQKPYTWEAPRVDV